MRFDPVFLGVVLPALSSLVHLVIELKYWYTLTEKRMSAWMFACADRREEKRTDGAEGGGKSGSDTKHSR